MSLLRCPNCGRNVSSNAIRCPNCGAPLNSQKNDTPPINFHEEDSEKPVPPIKNSVNNNYNLILIIVISSVIVVGIIGGWLYLSHRNHIKDIAIADSLRADSLMKDSISRTVFETKTYNFSNTETKDSPESESYEDSTNYTDEASTTHTFDLNISIDYPTKCNSNMLSILNKWFYKQLEVSPKEHISDGQSFVDCCGKEIMRNLIADRGDVGCTKYYEINLTINTNKIVSYKFDSSENNEGAAITLNTFSCINICKENNKIYGWNMFKDGSLPQIKSLIGREKGNEFDFVDLYFTVKGVCFIIQCSSLTGEYTVPYSEIKQYMKPEVISLLPE